MFPVKKEVLSFVHACEDIHALFDRGDTLTSEEQDLIEASCNELLEY
jgi:hypothetical protein